ncbi:restriction endonuclease subunit S [Vibrio parahaemolyticus]|nr:restriction endonuclease subunit S [Vibrio parahaemolyticus]
MSDYPWLPLGDLLSSIVGGGTPPRGEPSFWSGDIPWASVKDFEDGRLSLSNTQETISEKGLLNSTAKLIPAGTPIMCARMAVGRVALNSRPVAINQDLKALLPREGVNSKYLCYLIQHFQRDLDSNAIGSTVKGISTDAIKRFKVPYVESERVQQTIASILTTIDNQIDATQALIDKYTAIKQGMMADLFSRGIDPETKALRPTFEEAPELYHETPLGMLPKGWVCAPIKKFVQSAEYGISTSLNDDSSGIPVLRMNNIQNNRFNVEELKFTKDPEAYRLKLSTGDVLYNRTNSMEHVGKTAIWRGELSECSFASYLVRINVNKCELLPEYFSFWMSQESSQNALRAFATPAVQQVNINPTNLQRVLMSCPVSLLEQREIVDRIDAADAVLLREREVLLKLIAQKSGLMQDLLTGKVPVPA